MNSSTVPDATATPAPNKRDRILDAAARAFAGRGYLATSLRDIARDAECSLTLVDHHFGSKSDLLRTVVAQQHEHCRKRLSGLKTMIAQPEFGIESFIALWANYEFDLYATREGRHYLNLMLRLQADREIDEELRRTLNCSEASVVQGFRRAWPELDEDELRVVWLMASTALYAAVTSLDELPDGERQAASEAVRRRASAFLLDGLHAAAAARAEPA